MIRPPADRDKRESYYQKRYHADGVRVNQEMLDEEREFAEKCLESGDFERGLHAAAIAVPYRPCDPEFTGLVARFFAADPLKAQEVVDADLSPQYAANVLTVYAAHHRGDHAEAYRKLTEVARASQPADLPEGWGLDWLTEEVAAAVDSDTLTRFFGAFVQNRYGDSLTDYGRELIGRAADKAALAEKVHGRSGPLTITKCQMLSKAGRFDEAIAEAEGEAERSPSFNTCTAAAMANKRAGRIDKAVEWFRRSADLDRKNETALLDVGDLMIDAGNLRAALAAYEEALRRKPDHDWAVPSAAYCRYMISKSEDDLADLRRQAHGPRCTCGCASAFKSMLGGYNYEDRRERARALLALVDPNALNEGEEE